jgi:hypothetical protein
MPVVVAGANPNSLLVDQRAQRAKIRMQLAKRVADQPINPARR